jgi:hypothetical protein
MRSRCRIGYLKFWRRQAEMVWRETVHFSQARSVQLLIERGADIASAMESIQVTEDIAARGIAGKALRPQGE